MRPVPLSGASVVDDLVAILPRDQPEIIAQQIQRRGARLLQRVVGRVILAARRIVQPSLSRRRDADVIHARLQLALVQRQFRRIRALSPDRACCVSTGLSFTNTVAVKFGFNSPVAFR